MRSHSKNRAITKDAVAFVVAVIHESSSQEKKEVERDVMKWAKDGGRYRALADKLGGTWCYFFFPDISEWM